MNKKALVLI